METMTTGSLTTLDPFAPFCWSPGIAWRRYNLPLSRVLTVLTQYLAE